MMLSPDMLVFPLLSMSMWILVQPTQNQCYFYCQKYWSNTLPGSAISAAVRILGQNSLWRLNIIIQPRLLDRCCFSNFVDESNLAGILYYSTLATRQVVSIDESNLAGSVFLLNSRKGVVSSHTVALYVYGGMEERYHADLSRDPSARSLKPSQGLKLFLVKYWNAKFFTRHTQYNPSSFDLDLGQPRYLVEKVCQPVSKFARRV